ncbi:MAG: PilZ domain-containing protein [Nitrospira sp.]|nr:PilZ domain-containing protein [Nitrospira sp.]MCC7472294.1 PilZ domain-containing protein [Candidatus Nomurabacteria bacterium]
MARPLTCPHCGHNNVFRSRCATLVECLQSLAFISPFHCQSCSCRFSASRLGCTYSNQVLDRREHLRIPVRLFLSFSGGKIRGEGTVKDISMGGCVIESQASVHVDDIFYLQIVLENEHAPLEVAAMVRSVSSRGIAFKFLRSAQENKRLLAFVQSKTEPSGARPAV